MSVMLFAVSALIALSGAALSAEEGYTSWSQPQSVAFSVFAAANLLAAGLAVPRLAGLGARVLGTLTPVPAYGLMAIASGTTGDPSDPGEWLLVVAACALVVGGGMIASGLLSQLLHRTRR
jgi:hypothetical protein